MSIGYGKIAVAEKINFRLGEGELMAVVGVNGSGKSTLLRTLSKLQPQLSGDVLIAEKSLSLYTHQELASRLSVVLTNPLASKNMTVFELISLGRQPYTNWLGTLANQDKREIEIALERLQLSDIQHRKCYELSDGQLQRVMIARALAQNSPVIVLDEPTTHLDLYHKVRILKLLKSIAKETQKAILYTTHEIDMAIQLCDRMLVLNGGTNPFGQPCELISDGTFDQLFPADTLFFDSETGSFRIEK